MNKNTDDVILTIGDAKALYECQGHELKVLGLADVYIRRMSRAVALVDRAIAEAPDYGLADMLGRRWKEKQADVCAFLKKAPLHRLADYLMMDAMKGLVQLDHRWRDMPNMLIAKSDEILYVGLVQLFVEHDAKSEVVRHHKRLMNELHIRLELAA